MAAARAPRRRLPTPGGPRGVSAHRRGVNQGVDVYHGQLVSLGRAAGEGTQARQKPWPGNQAGAQHTGFSARPAHPGATKIMVGAQQSRFEGVFLGGKARAKLARAFQSSLQPLLAFAPGLASPVDQAVTTHCPAAAPGRQPLTHPPVACSMSLAVVCSTSCSSRLALGSRQAAFLPAQRPAASGRRRAVAAPIAALDPANVTAVTQMSVAYGELGACREWQRTGTD